MQDVHYVAVGPYLLLINVSFCIRTVCTVPVSPYLGRVEFQNECRVPVQAFWYFSTVDAWRTSGAAGDAWRVAGPAAPNARVDLLVAAFELLRREASKQYGTVFESQKKKLGRIASIETIYAMTVRTQWARTTSADL